MYTLDDILSPVDRVTFAEEFFGKAPLHCKGRGDRWSTLVTWDEVVKALKMMRSRDRLRMVAAGKPLDQALFLEDKDRYSDRLVNVAAVERHLQRGATLVINNSEEIFPGVHALWTSLRSHFAATVDAGVFVARRDKCGLDIHWDEIDGFVVQVAGRKRWRVYRPETPWPRLSMKGTTPRPSRPPEWDGVLEAGDVLYVPRGWWHAPVPMNELTVHVTLGVLSLTARDIFQWLADAGTDSIPICRAPLPILSTANSQQTYTTQLREAISEVLSTNVVDAFTRLKFSRMMLDRVVVPTGASHSHNGHVSSTASNAGLRLSDRHRLCFSTATADLISFEAAGVQWTCSRLMMPALSLLSDTSPIDPPELLKAVEPSVRDALNGLISALNLAGALRSA